MPSISRRKEIIKIRAEINAKETKETIVKFNKAKSWFFEKINKIDKPLARFLKKKRKKNQINKIMEKSQQITEIQRIIRDYYQKLYADKMDTSTSHQSRDPELQKGAWLTLDEDSAQRMPSSCPVEGLSHP